MQSERNGAMTVAILATDGVERVELTEPRKALEAQGITTKVVSPANGALQGWDHDEKSEKIPVDVPLGQAKSADFDGLLLPGGVRNPDVLRMSREAVRFVREFVDAHKPVAAICHAPWLLVQADAVRGMRLTSWPSLHTDIDNARGIWVDEPVVEDRWLVTSRKPDDIPAFNDAAIRLFKSAAHRRVAESAATG